MNSLIGAATTAADLPWSNGITKRQNAMISIMKDKILNEEKCSNEIVLPCAIIAMNCLQNNYGFSPNQLVNRKNSYLLNALENKSPA